MTMNKGFTHKIGTTGNVYTCGSCGKRTRETGYGESDLDLCAQCYNAAGYENEHSDNDGLHNMGNNVPMGKDPAQCPSCLRELEGTEGPKGLKAMFPGF